MKFQVNSFTLSLPDVSPIGVAISPVVAMANHSCDPNAVVVFPNGGRCMELVAIRDIEPNEEVSQCVELTDKQILTSYIDVSLPVEKRRSELEATYRFKCECSLCLRDIEIRNPGYEGVEVDLRAAVRHRDCKRKAKGKGSLPLGWEDQGKHLERALRGEADICRDESHTMCEMQGTIHPQHCRTASPISASNSFARGRCKGSRWSVFSTHPRVNMLTQVDLTQTSTLFQLIPALHAILIPSSFPLLSLLRLQLLRVRPSTSIELAHLDRLYSIVVSSSILVCPTNHPVLAILHAEWGQILTQTFDGEGQDLVSGRMVKSVELLRKAYDLCQKSFGKEGGIEGKQVAEVLRGLEAEIQMARSSR